jgi:hypothetical protein
VIVQLVTRFAAGLRFPVLFALVAGTLATVFIMAALDAIAWVLGR